MSYEQMVILGYTIAPAAMAAAWRWRKVEARYYPILVLLQLGFVNEIVSSVVIANGHSNAVNNNIFLLAEALLLLVQFKRLGLFVRRSSWYHFGGFLMIALWIWENRNWQGLQVIGPVFIVVSSAMIVVMSIFCVNLLVISYTGVLLRSATFLFCCGFCCYFSTMLLLELFLSYGAGLSMELQAAAFKASCIVNAICNFLFLIAVLWIPQKPRFIMY